MNLGALKMAEKGDRWLKTSSGAQTSPSITSLGRTMAQFPVAPRYARMLALGRQHGCLPYIIAMVAALSVKEIFAESDMSSREDEGEEDDEATSARKRQGRIASARRAWAGKVNVVCVCVCE